MLTRDNATNAAHSFRSLVTAVARSHIMLVMASALRLEIANASSHKQANKQPSAPTLGRPLRSPATATAKLHATTSNCCCNGSKVATRRCGAEGRRDALTPSRNSRSGFPTPLVTLTKPVLQVNCSSGRGGAVRRNGDRARIVALAPRPPATCATIPAEDGNDRARMPVPWKQILVYPPRT